jgi:hypothetical protein
MFVSAFEVRSAEAMLNVESRNARKVIYIRNKLAMGMFDNVISCGKWETYWTREYIFWLWVRVVDSSVFCVKFPSETKRKD